MAHGQASVAEVDFALMHGVGVRWAAVGLFGAYFLNLADPDVHTWLDHFKNFDCGEPIVHTGAFPEYTPQWSATVAQQWEARIRQTGADALLRERDALAIELARRREPR